MSLLGLEEMAGSQDVDDEGEGEIKPGAKEGSLLFHTFMYLMGKDSC